MAQIRIDWPAPPVDGAEVKFKAPCDCTAVTGIKLCYLDAAGEETSKSFTFRDAHGFDLTGLGNLFGSGAYVKAILDVTNGRAYLQNADTNAYLEGKIANASTPFNYAHNSDFTQWVAQAGIGGSHGNQAYGGDRWILDSGTINGDERADGNGYENITLSGTVRQIVANPPAVGAVGVDMISGTATASYADGEITITSSGGVIKDVWLYEGTYEAGAAPKFQPKGYGAELAECMRYCEQGVWIQLYCNNHKINNSFSFKVKKRSAPTIIIYSRNGASGKFSVYDGGWQDFTPTNVYGVTEDYFLVNTDQQFIGELSFRFAAFADLE